MRDTTFGGKVAIVTGGASGIGAALAKQMARAGTKVILADRQVDLAESVASAIRADGGAATAAELDVRSLESMTRVVQDTVARSHSIDYFFNNAGIGVGGDIDTYEPRDWDEVFDVNLRGVAHGVQAVYPVMIRQGSGHIINTASVAGLLPCPGEGGYSATKHAVVGLSKALRIEARRHGVRVSALCPGVIRTPILTGGKFGRINVEGLSEGKILEMWEKMRPMDADVFAGKVLRAVARNEAIIVVPAWWKALWYLERLAPTVSTKLWERVHARMRADLEAAGVQPPGRLSEVPSTKARVAQAEADA